MICERLPGFDSAHIKLYADSKSFLNLAAFCPSFLISHTENSLWRPTVSSTWWKTPMYWWSRSCTGLRFRRSHRRKAAPIPKRAPVLYCRSIGELAFGCGAAAQGG
jgi:hypothetical protein